MAWIHDLDNEPILLYSEIGDDRYETRKVEIYKDGSFGVASADFEFGGTMLGDATVPGIEEIREDAQFIPYSIDAEEFEDVWFQYINFLDKKK